MNSLKKILVIRASSALRIFFLICFISWSVSYNVLSQGIDDDNDLPVDTSEVINVIAEKDWDLFGKDDLVRLSLMMDIKQFQRGKNKPEYQDAILRIYQDDSIFIDKKVKIKPRGQFRRSYCHFPPIKLNLKKTDFDNEYMSNQTTMKFVTQCKNANVYESYILKEYLIYKMYNTLTDYSFRVRLILMEYVDTGKKQKVFSKYSFLIEHLNSVSSRNNTVVIDNEKLSQKMMDQFVMGQVALFEYMIGNTDWSVPGLHNMKVIKLMDFNKPEPFPVPYDFDYSGMVDTEYAIPIEELGIESVRERLYRGICLPETVTKEVIAHFIKRKNAIYKVVNDFQLLEKRDKKNMLDYLDSFYRVLDSDYLVRNEIRKSCIEIK